MPAKQGIMIVELSWSNVCENEVSSKFPFAEDYDDES